LKKKVLFVSDSHKFHVNNHLLDSFYLRSDINLEVIHAYPDFQRESIIKKIFEKIKLPIDFGKVNNLLIKKVYNFNPDIILIVKGNTIFPNTLKKIKKINSNIKIVSWSLDDMYAFHNRSFYYTYGLKYYDDIFTTKSYNMNELKKFGSFNIHFIYQAFSYLKHKVNKLDTTTDKDVSFIGYPEDSRFNSIKYLARNGIKVEVAGGGGKWKRSKYQGHKNILIHDVDYFGIDYRNFIAKSKINLCFLRKLNRDLHTSRSLEIPACGGFMLAERTNEHEYLFKDKTEVVFFDNDEDLLKKVKYYLNNEKKRDKIRRAGHRRCISSNYSYDKMTEIILSKIL
jgi:spore maturation protein CgeB